MLHSFLYNRHDVRTQKGGGWHTTVSKPHSKAERERSRKRDTEREFERLYRESYETVYYYIRRRMSDEQETEDIVAEAYLRAARSFEKYDPARAKFSTWVVKIATNCMKSHWRRSHVEQRIEDVPDHRLTLADETAQVADRDMVERLLDALDGSEERLVLMKYREGYRNVDIAAELNMNASTVSTALARALAKMRAAANAA